MASKFCVDCANSVLSTDGKTLYCTEARAIDAAATPDVLASPNPTVDPSPCATVRASQVMCSPAGLWYSKKNGITESSIKTGKVK